MEPFVFPSIDIPMDASDHYVYSFDAEMINNIDMHAEMTNFFDEYGYIVFSNVLQNDQIELTKNAMWEILETMNPGFKHDDVRHMRMATCLIYNHWILVIVVRLMTQE